MATGVVIRLKNLPLVAGTIDIRHFFGGLRIPDGGVHIIGGEDGTAFILFSTDEDARRAMLQDGQLLCSSKIRLMLSSHTEMKNVIEDSQRICEELRGLRPPEPPITNLSSRSTAAGYQQIQRHFPAKTTSPKVTPEMPEVNDVHIEIKGMPFSVTESDIIYFFSPLNVVAVRFMLDEKGRKIGNGFVKFNSAMDKAEGLKRDRKYIGSRFVKLTSTSERQWLVASSQPCETIRLGVDGSRKRTQSHVSPNDGTPKRSRAFSPLRTDNCVEVRGLPSSASFKSVGDFFSRLRFVEGGLFVEMDGQVCKGSAYAEFSSYSDYKEALEKDGDMLNGKQVRVIGLSKQNMIEQIQQHKKYVKAKREEQYNRDRIEREREKKAQEKKVKDEENLQKKREYQLRKQKEMDEWLRRQHEKEENDRKRRDLERQVLAQSIESMKSHEEQQQLNDKQNIDLLHAKQEASEEEVQNLQSEESAAGAGEMDLEDDDNNIESTSSTATTTFATTIQQNLTSSSTYAFPPIFGNSGSAMTSALPLGFNPGLPIMNPAFALSNMAQMQARFQSNLPTISAPNLLLANPPMMSTSQPPMLNNPPLPPTILPPPTPPAVIPTTMPPMKPDPPLPTQPASVRAPMPQHPPAKPEVVSEYVRVANSPYTVTEDSVREFFSGLAIPKHGIQFVNKPNSDRRSGHIFIKFASHEDAAKAALKENHKLLGRSVLVRLSSLKQFSQIYEKVNQGGTYIPSFNGPADEPAPPTISTDDNFFTKRILDDKMMCVCVGNLPPSTTEEEVIKALGDIKFVKGRVIVVRNADGKCKGDVYVELQSPQDCVKAANLHGNVKILGEIIRVLPLSIEAMQKDIEGHRSKSTDVKSSSSKSNGFSNHSTPKIPPHYPDRAVNRPKEPFPPPPPFNSRELPHFDGPPPPFNPSLPPPGLPGRDFYRGPIDVPPPLPPFSPMDMMLHPHSPTPDDLMRMSGRPMIDPPFGFPPPPLGPRFPMGRPPFPMNPPGFLPTLQMSNLSFKVTREDILEFFTGFDPLPDSVRLMYNKNGKPTGDGVISFPNIDAARAAIDKRHLRPLLSRKIKLLLQ